MTERRTNITFFVALAMFATAVTVIANFEGTNDEIKSVPMGSMVEPAQASDIDVCIVNLQWGSRPILLWSNRRAKPNADGTITISTSSEGDF